MGGKNEGVVAQIQKVASLFGNEEFLHHCILHQGNLCAKNMSFKNVMKDTITIVNFIRSQELIHREFQTFLKDMEAEDGDVYDIQVRWLSSQH
jgi:hypothetical protein